MVSNFQKDALSVAFRYRIFIRSLQRQNIFRRWFHSSVIYKKRNHVAQIKIVLLRKITTRRYFNIWKSGSILEWDTRALNEQALRHWQNHAARSFFACASNFTKLKCKHNHIQDVAHQRYEATLLRQVFSFLLTIDAEEKRRRLFEADEHVVVDKLIFLILIPLLFSSRETGGLGWKIPSVVEAIWKLLK